MTVRDFINGIPRRPWQGLSRIPWDDPGFSARMLREHLDQSHDRASRPAPFIARQVDWLHEMLRPAGATDLLDLGCGPGLYCRRLADLGHHCTGVDISPASIEHARAENLVSGRCEYRLEDFRELSLGRRFDAALLLSGELNAFSPADVRKVLRRAAAHLHPDGLLFLEVHNLDDIERIGRCAPAWYRASHGVFSDTPHLVVKESSWHPRERAAIEVYLVLSENIEARCYVTTLQGYMDDELDASLRAAGFEPIETSSAFPVQDGARGIVARRTAPAGRSTA